MIRSLCSVYTLVVLMAIVSGCDADEGTVITSFSPSSGTPGTAVTIVGRNFSTEKANVFFYGEVPAEVISVSKTDIVAIVPALANSGAITVRGESEFITEQEFTILPQWTDMAPLPSFERANAFAFSIGTKGYVGAGYESGIRHRDFWEYDTEQNTWTRKADFPGRGTSSAAAVSIDGKGYVGVGMINSLEISKEFWSYNPSTDTWEALPDFPGTGRNGFVFVAENKMYLGTDGVMWQFNPASGWSSRAPYPGRADYGHTGFGVGPYGYVGGGIEQTGVEEFKSTSDFWRYDPGTDVWLRKADVPRGGSSGAGLSINGRGYFVWSWKQTFEYDVEADRWNEQQQSPKWAGIIAPTAFVVGNKAYVGTGVNETSDARNTFYVFDPGK